MQYKNIYLADAENEQWLQILNYEQYSISNYGRVKALAKSVRAGRHADKQMHYPERILKQSLSHGYLRISLSVNGKSKKMFVHRLVAQAFKENHNSAPFVNHKDFNPLNNNSENLEWCTQQENVIYSRKQNRYADTKGSKHPMSQITEDIAISIRSLYEKGCKQMELARKFNVSIYVVYSVIKGRTWKHV